MVERGLEPDFPQAELAEVEQLAEPVPSPSPDVVDLRDLLWCSIDNDDSRDLDQLTVASPGTGGSTSIMVAVADVSGLVPIGSALDRHAGKNTTSVYTEAQTFPMLPLRLSTDLTSLNPNEDRYAVVVEALVDAEGGVSGGKVYRAIVRIRRVRDGIRLEIHDDGKSFSADRILSAKHSGHLGLLGMRERVEIVGGRFAVESAPGTGTTIAVEIPFDSTSTP